MTIVPSVKVREITTHLCWECQIVNDFCHLDLYINGKEAICRILKFNKETKLKSYSSIFVKNIIFRTKV